MKSLTAFAAVSALAFSAHPGLASRAHAADNPAGPQPSARPNILVLVADDLGYADISAQGARPDIATPCIDSLARNGVRFTAGYVTNPVCAPSRAALLTGRNQQRFGFEYNPGTEEEAPANFGIPRGERLFSERLKALDYATAAIGKWHVGYRPELQPRQRGFDTFYGHLNGAHHYMNNDDGLLQDNGSPLQKITYTTTLFGDYAVDFIRRHKAAPWGIYLAYSAVHGRIRAPESYLRKFAHIADVKRRTLLAMMAAMDDSVGGILNALRETGQLERTLVVFISDNGGLPSVNASLNTPFRGGKGELYEGGVRVPFLMQWPGVIPAGLVYDRPVSATDIVPTIMAAVGLPADPRLDGVNLLPFLSGKKTGTPHETLCWRVKNSLGWTIRQGDWKLFSNQKNNPKTLELYHLADDPGETTNLAEKQPGKVKELRAAWHAWDKDNIEPLWGNRKKLGGKKKKAARAGGGDAD
ncbi:MAG: sulfatase-like hydrolase/transferase [Opitutaceae bacterium]|jgi:arylsulfatase A-like enzyme|nr:sulfatase-like hydrolase/transferase [Opitutaceae bacterium]